MATGYGITTRVEFSNEALLGRIVDGLQRPREFMQKVGLLGLSSGLRRLQEGYSQDDDAYRSGRLQASLSVGGEGNVFDLGDDFVAVGTNLPYAAQHQKGGTILPKRTKALAIPLQRRLKVYGIWPRDYPGALKFVPINRGNAVGFLVDDTEDEAGTEGQGTVERQVFDKRTGKTVTRKVKKRRVTGRRGRKQYLLVRSVTQEARPFLFWDEADKAQIVTLWREHVGLA